MEKESLIIAGAGAAGLMAAYLLADKMQVTILEAQPRTGGRIHTLQAIEAGAEFVHGDLPVTFGLLKKAGIEAKQIEGKIVRHKNGRLTEEEEMIEGWDGLLKKMKDLEEDMTVDEFLNRYYASHDELKKEVKAYTEGFDLADPAKASVLKLYEEWKAEDEANYRIPAGYGSLIAYLRMEAIKKGVVIITGKIIKQVDWETNDVTVYTSGGEKFYGNKLLVTVPISILARTAGEASINFTPELDAYEHAAQQIGFGEVIKVIVEFKKPLWQKDTGFIISNELFRTWWTQSPADTPILTGWLGGPKAAAASLETDEIIIEKALGSLAVIFNKTAEEIKMEVVNKKIFNWQKNAFSLGGYSYSMPGSEKAKALLNTPVAGTIFFAGEGLYSGKHPGTVEAALVSSTAMAKHIEGSLK